MDLPTAIEVVTAAHQSSQWNFESRLTKANFDRRAYAAGQGSVDPYAAVYGAFASLLELPSKLFEYTKAAFCPLEPTLTNPTFVAFRDVFRLDKALPDPSKFLCAILAVDCIKLVSIMEMTCAVPGTPGNMFTVYVVQRKKADPTSSMACLVTLSDGDATCECAEDNKRFVAGTM